MRRSNYFPALSDCIISDRSIAELYIVRSGPVANLAKYARDRERQAVLPLTRGIIGLHHLDLFDALDNEDLKGMIAALGIGICLGDDLSVELERLRYGKIIIATEKTTLGIAFREEIVTLMHRWMPPLIAEGHVSTTFIPPAALLSAEDFEEVVMNPAKRILTPCDARFKGRPSP